MTTRRPRAAPPSERDAFTLIELLLALVLTAVIGAIVGRLLTASQRTYDGLVRVVDQRAQLRDAAAILPDALRGASIPGGDLLALSDSAVELRTAIGTAVACDVRSAGTRLELVPATLASGQILAAFADAPKVDDLVEAYDPGTQAGNADDAWRTVAVIGATTTTASCSGSALVDSVLDAGRTRWRLDVFPALPPTIAAGAPVRVMRRARYRLYRSGAEWWLGYAEWSATGWSTVQPVSGPLRPYSAAGASGLAFRYRDSTGAWLSGPAALARTAQVEIAARAVTSGTLRIPGRQVGPAADSTLTAVALRNVR